MSDFFKRLLGLHKLEIVDRPPRIPEKSLQNIKLRLVSPARENCDCNLFNLSTKGVAFYKNPCMGNIEVQTNLEGSLYFHDKAKHDLELTIVHAGLDHFGCRITNQNEMLNQFIANYFKHELAALKMVKINSSHLSPATEGVPHWYHGNNNCEFYFIERDRQIVKGHFSLFGNYIEIKSNGSILVGSINDGEIGDKGQSILYKNANTINVLNEMDPTLKEGILKFLLNIPDLDNKIRYGLIEKIERS